jgi:hypothetical protein
VARKKTELFERPANVRRLLIGLFVFLGALLVAGPLLPHHPHFYWDAAPNFHAAYGFAAYVVLIYLAKGLRRLLKREEDYYER